MRQAQSLLCWHCPLTHRWHPQPTNHLDLSAVIWLEATLQQWPNTLLLVSHSRGFLDNVCTDIIHLHARKLTAFRGNFGSFEAQRAERARCSEKRAEADSRKRKHMQAFLYKFGALRRQRAKLVQNRIARLESHIDRVGISDDPQYLFHFPEPAAVNPPVIGFHDVTFAYPSKPDKPIFRDVSFGFDMDSRVALVGPNGVGKTTLLNLMQGVLDPQTGHVSRNPKVRMAAFSQHHVDDLDMTATPVSYMQGCFSGAPAQELRNHLGSFGISGTLATQTIFTLSGGQKSRVALAKITWGKPGLLLLDEISNHLDIESVDALIQGLSLFKGGVLLISHDEHLITNAADEIWVAGGDGRLLPWKGTFQEYKNTLLLAPPAPK